MPDLPAILDAMHEKPEEEAGWLAGVGWVWDTAR
jgi:hypothetical protein